MRTFVVRRLEVAAVKLLQPSPLAAFWNAMAPAESASACNIALQDDVAQGRYKVGWAEQNST